MGIAAVYRNPSTRRRHPKHKVYPQPPQGVKIVRPHQVWAMGVLRIPMTRVFGDLVAMIAG